MPAPIPGIRVTENVYLKAHASGRHFRHRAHDPVLPPVVVTIVGGAKVRTATMRDRKPRQMTDAGILAMLARVILGQETVKVTTPAFSVTRVYHKRGQHARGPTLAIRG